MKFILLLAIIFKPSYTTEDPTNTPSMSPTQPPSLSPSIYPCKYVSTATCTCSSAEYKIISTFGNGFEIDGNASYVYEGWYSIINNITYYVSVAYRNSEYNMFDIYTTKTNGARGEYQPTVNTGFMNQTVQFCGTEPIVNSTCDEEYKIIDTFGNGFEIDRHAVYVHEGWYAVIHNIWYYVSLAYGHDDVFPNGAYDMFDIYTTTTNGSRDEYQPTVDTGFINQTVRFCNQFGSTNNPTTSSVPTLSPTKGPTHLPSFSPSKIPNNPAIDPIAYPTITPTNNPTHNPIKQPSKTPTNGPSDNPTQSPTDYEFCLDNSDDINAGFITLNNEWSDVICEFCVCRDHIISDLICDIIDFNDIKRYDSYLINNFMKTCQLDQECSFKQVGLKKPSEEITLCDCDLFQCNPIANNANTFIFGVLIVLEAIIVMFLFM